MRRRAIRGLILALPVMFALLACTVGGGATSSVVGTVAPTPVPCATRATTTAEAWVVGQQVYGKVGSGAVGQLSNFVSPLGLSGEQDSGSLAWYLGNIVFAPDGRHLAVDVYLPFPDSIAGTYPYVVDTTTHAVTRVNISADTGSDGLRNLTWADNNTLLVLTGDSPGKYPVPETAGLYSYNVSTNAVSALPGITHMATDGVARCSTLFYMEVTPFTNIGVDSNGANEFRGSAILHRYNLSTHTETGSPVTFSDTFNADGSFEFYIVPGWDVSADGTKIAYQHMAVHLSTSAHDYSIHSTFAAANADGSGAAAIFGGSNPVYTYSGTYLTISPNGQYVAVTDAFPTPDVATDSMSGGSVRYYSPDAYGSVGWLSDSSGFDATTESGSNQNITRYLLSTPLGTNGRAPGVTQVPNAHGPTSLG